MTLGRTSSNAIKIKIDEEGGGLRAVECACCGGCPEFPSNICFNGVKAKSWEVDLYGGCSARFEIGCSQGDLIVLADGFAPMLCGGVRFALFVTGDGSSACLGVNGTWFICKSDGIDSPIGQYSGYIEGLGNVTWNITEIPEGQSTC
jgi:hypothetical protein